MTIVRRLSAADEVLHGGIPAFAWEFPVQRWTAVRRGSTVGGDPVAGVEYRSTVEAGEPAAGLLDDHRHRGQVVGLCAVVHHGVGVTAGHHRVSERVAPGAAAPCPGCAGRSMVSGSQSSSQVAITYAPSRCAVVGHPGRRAVAPAAASALGVHHDVRAWQVDQPEDHLVAFLEGDEVGVERYSADEGFGSVDGVDGPAVVRCALGVGVFLAGETVRRGTPRPPPRAWRARSGDPPGDRGSVGLGLDRQVGCGEVPPRGLAGDLGQLEGEADHSPRGCRSQVTLLG